MVGCLAASLDSAHQMPIVPCPLVLTTKNATEITIDPLRDKIVLSQDHFSVILKENKYVYHKCNCVHLVLLTYIG